VLREQIEQRLKQRFPDCRLEIVDLTGGGDHYRVQIRSSEFQGLSLIKQHQKVYEALQDLLSGPLHALQLDTGS
jgi:stress-induced morphogen